MWPWHWWHDGASVPQGQMSSVAKHIEDINPKAVLVIAPSKQALKQVKKSTRTASNDDTIQCFPWIESVSQTVLFCGRVQMLQRHYTSQVHWGIPLHRLPKKQSLRTWSRHRLCLQGGALHTVTMMGMHLISGKIQRFITGDSSLR